MVTSPILAEIPLTLEKAGVGDYLLERLHLDSRKQPDWTAWSRIVEETKKEKPEVTIALVGKYVELHDAYISVREAMKHASLALGVKLKVNWILSTDLEKGKGVDLLEASDGVVIPGGFGSRGIEGKISAAHYARINKVPYLGLCLGMQLMVVDFGRELLGTDQVNSTEFDHTTPNPVIDLMPGTGKCDRYGGHHASRTVPLRFTTRNDCCQCLPNRTRCKNVTATALNLTIIIGSLFASTGWSFPAFRRMEDWLKLPNSKTTHSCWVHNFILNFSRDPTGRIRSLSHLCVLPV